MQLCLVFILTYWNRNSAGKTFNTKVFLSGDYAFLYQMYGLSGASGKWL